MLTLQKISSLTHGYDHCGFTDLIASPNGLLVTYRQGSDHVSPDGMILVQRLSKSTNAPVQQTRLRYTGWDLRDPKLTEHKGRYFLQAYGRKVDEHNRALTTCVFNWFSDDGISWSSEHRNGPAYWWLWRTRWFQDKQWGLAYNRAASQLDLYCGSPRAQFESVASGVLSEQRHGLGYPNESDVHFNCDGTLYALVRRDADSFSAQLGISRSPYHRWQWHDLKEYIGGPVWVPLNERLMLVAGRAYTGRKLVTRIWTLCLDSKALTPLIDLPSGGDNSYPGLVMDGDTLLVSYYSQHIDNVCRIYLAQLSGLDVIKQR